MKFLAQSQLYVMMLESVRLGNAEVLCDFPDGVTLRDKPSGAIMTAATNAEVAARMMDIAGDSGLFTAHDCYTRQEIARRNAHLQEMACHQAVYPHNHIDIDERFDIQRLGETDVGIFLENYTGYDDSEYETERIRSGVMRGAYIDGILAGFVGRHAEGSIGLMKVLPQFRRRGVGEALLRHMVSEYLSEGRRPFSQIVCGNEPSEALHRKLGFVISEDLMYWFS